MSVPVGNYKDKFWKEAEQNGIVDRAMLLP